MSSHQIEIKFMLSKLMEWNQQLGGSQGKRSLANSEFDYLQEEFLSKRHLVEKYQDQKEKQGLTVANAELGYNIREGLEKMRELVGKMQEEVRRLKKKKKDTPQILQKKQRIVQNCELLLKDAEQRETENVPKYVHKATTLADMKAKLLKDIDVDTMAIHESGSDGALSDVNEEEVRKMAQWRKKDEQMDVVIDDITAGIKGVRHKVKMINEGQDKIVELQQKNEEKIDKVSARIKKDNDQLKEIIEKFKPNRCCLVIALFLLLAGLIVCVIKLLI